MSDEMDRVVPLDELEDFEIADGEPDVRGWEVLSADGRRIGEVDELLIDTAAMKVRYLDVDLADDLSGAANQDRHILIPIGYAQLHETDNLILVDGLHSADVTALPEYTHAPVTREYERLLRQSFDPDDSSPADTDEPAFYEHRGYDQDRFFGRRRPDDGSEAGVERNNL